MSAPQQASAFNNQIPPRYTIKNITAAYTVTGADYGVILNCTGTTSYTLNLVPASSVGLGFNVWIWNQTATTAMQVTITPNGSETIDGVATLILNRGEGTQIVCDGTNWQTGAKKTMRLYSENSNATNARNTVTGSDSLAIGWSSTASNIRTVAIGNVATASGDNSLAVGRITTAGSTYSSAIGANSAGSGATTATGAGAMALGGSYASGTDSFAASVVNNTNTYGATGANSIAIGNLAKATGSYSVAIGRTALATQDYAVSFFNASVGVIGKIGIGIGGTVATGIQYGLVNLYKQTADAVATSMSTNGSTAGSTNQVVLPNNSAFTFNILVVARQSAAGGTASASWQITGLIRREGTAASTTLVASTVTTISNVPAWTIAVTADTTNGALAITATGAAATDIRWVATAQTSEVIYA
mgnify:CR=1 FL=1